MTLLRERQTLLHCWEMANTDKSSKKPDMEKPLDSLLDEILSQQESDNPTLRDKQARLLQKLSGGDKSEQPAA